MLFKKEVLLLGIVLLLSCQNDCAVVENAATNETLDQIQENEQETTHPKLQKRLENQPNRSEEVQSLVAPRSCQMVDGEISNGKQKLPLISEFVELQNQRQLETTKWQEPKTSNQSEQTEEVRSPHCYRLRILQLGNPEVSPLQEFKDYASISEQLPKVETVALELPPSENALPNPVLKHLLNRKTKALVKSEQRVPVPADSVTVLCGEREILVDVKQNFLGNGQLIHPSDLTLGGCSVTYASDQTIHFRAELQSCGSTMTMSEEALVYSFSLLYAPTPIGSTFILKTNPAEVVIECHYPRKHYVSSKALSPTWVTFSAEKLTEQQLHFSLQLMTEDWQSRRSSSVYFLNDVMHIEASVLRGHHIPLRVFVDVCVATTQPDPESEPRYVFVNNRGCLIDSKLTGGKSYFMQRSQEDKLHFKLEMFRFLPDHRDSVYITCKLRATPLSVPIDSQNKACSFLTEANRWVASEGDNKVCGCCESSCGETRRKRGLGADADLQWEGTTVLGPIINEVEELPDVGSLGQTFEVTKARSASLALLCGVGAALGILLLMLLLAITVYKVNKSTRCHIKCKIPQ